MRILKFFSVFCLILLLCNSCEKEKAHQIVFYSVDQLKQDLAVKVNKTDGYAVSVNSNAVIYLKSSAVFKKNIDLLKDVEVQKF